MNKHACLYDVNYLYKSMYAYKSPSVNRRMWKTQENPPCVDHFPNGVSPWVPQFFFGAVDPRAGTYWITMALVVLGEDIDGC